MKFSTLAEWLGWLEELHPSTIDLGLDRVGEVASRAGLMSPSFPIITVGGTNGKGSVCSVLESVLVTAGYKVGLYTSPHIFRYNERVRIGGSDVNDAVLCAAFDRIEAARGETSLTYFEYGTLAAMQAFQDSEADIVILEVGLGGRLDAVNLWDAAAAVITSLALDHTDWLGETLDDIAGEKVEIARHGRPLIVGEPNPPQRLIDRAIEISAELQLRNRDFFAEPESDENWHFIAPDKRLDKLPMPGITGTMRCVNAATAIQALRQLDGVDVTETQLRTGVANSSLKGRAHHILVDGIECIFDVAHNPQAISAFAEYLASTASGGRTLAVAAFMADKAIPEMLDLLSTTFSSWYTGDLDMPRAMQADELASLVKDHVKADVYCENDIKSALKCALTEATSDDRIAVFGSFITVAELLPEHL